ncbi:putative small lipoprotein YifL [Arthrobacter sp. CAN_A2]|uniref:hypothetical protein n=1 Tax=Arthrobacter sp. CAN_A2 TaxID=2787718 RepID=UPI0018F056B9
MKKLLTLTALLLALTACGSQEPSSEASQQPPAEVSQQPTPQASQQPTAEASQQLSTEDTCSEVEVILKPIDSGMSDEKVAEMAGQLDDLATGASDALQDPLQTLADIFAKGRAEVQTQVTEMPELKAEFENAAATVSEECGI